MKIRLLGWVPYVGLMASAVSYAGTRGPWFLVAAVCFLLALLPGWLAEEPSDEPDCGCEYCGGTEGDSEAPR